MMFRTIFALSLCAVLCAGQDLTKIRKIYSDMDSIPDGYLYVEEIYAFFSRMSSNPEGVGLTFYDFDYGWSVTNGYNDPLSVTQYFFLQWDTNNNFLLDGADLTVLFNEIDTSSPGTLLPSIDVDFEFTPYMWSLYTNATMASKGRPSRNVRQ